MKQIFTLFVFFCSLFSFSASAQFYENFEKPEDSLVGNCWKIQQLLNTTQTAVLAGTQSLISTPLNAGKVQGKMTTPWLDVDSAFIRVSFQWRLLNTMPGNAFRSITISLIDSAGTLRQLDAISIPAGFPATPQQYAKSFPIAFPGRYQVHLDFDGKTGDGNQHLVFDEYRIAGADYHYGPYNHCNSAPAAYNDVFSRPSRQPVGGNVLKNDVEPNGERVKILQIGNNPDGIVKFYGDGSFTFYPNLTFAGKSTTFRYQLTDNGYTPLSSNVATVTINFFEGSTLPITLLHFSGRKEGDKVVLQWQIAENELADRFIVEKSTNDTAFTMAGVLFVHKSTGTAAYSLKDQASPSPVFYRLRMITDEGRPEFSRTISILPEQSGQTAIQLQVNPVRQQLVFSFDAPEAGPMTLSVYSAAGHQLMQRTITAARGYNSASVDLPQDCRAGLHLLQISGKRFRNTVRFVKQ